MKEPAFVHLRLHSEFSLVDSVVRIKPLMDAVSAAGMPAVALTDQSNLFGLIRFYRAALAAGVKPIAGADLWVCEDGEPPSRLTLLCQNPTGYRNICTLVSRAYRGERYHGRPLVRRGWLEGRAADGLIALSAGRHGDVGRALLSGRAEAAGAALDFWRRLFPDRYYLELQRTGRADEDAYNQGAVALASRTGTPVVATNDVRFIGRDDFGAHEARVCIHEGHTLTDPGRPREYSREQYIKDGAEMAALFEDLPEAVANTVEIARRCNLTLTLGQSVLPDFPVPEGMDANEYLAVTAGDRLGERLSVLVEESGVGREAYEQRLARELAVICGMGFAGYFLIVADFIQWAKDNGVPVGPGRGSGAGSLVAYVLGITDLDPLRYDLLFERFLNPERVSMPDFDIDFCMEGRDRVIDYVAARYGRESVSQIITFGTMAARAVVRDVGRVLGHPYGFVDRIAKLIPFEIGMTLEKALAEDEELARTYREDEEVRAVIDLARRLEGLARNAGKHAGGVVIAPGPLTDFTPLYCEEGGGGLVSQFDKDDVEAAGLVKFDFLGLRTLTIIDRAVHTINDLRPADTAPLDIGHLPLDDPATYTLMKAQDTTAVFQLESRGMKDLIKRLQPDCFDDVVALVALFRPGPLQSGMVDDFINRKHGRNQEPIDYFHPSLEPILKPTYGVILYQEQVMQIAQVLAGYSLGAADLLRRAMGKKKPEEMAKQRSIFVEGAVARGVAQGTATYIFDLMEKFAGYGFNKSHSAAYALLSYQTAWLKAHHRAAFMSAVLSADMDHTDKVVRLKHECDKRGSPKIEPPDVNASRYEFTVSGADSLRYGLGAIKGVGQGVIQELIAARERDGAFENLMDLCVRLDSQKANRRVFEALIRAGALDGLGANRATLMHQLPLAMKRAEQRARAAEAGQSDFFGLTADAPVAEFEDELPLETLPDWSDAERLAGERETLGLYLTGHPIDEHLPDLADLTSGRIAEIAGAEPPAAGGYGRPRPEVTVAGYVIDVRRRGNRVSLELDDNSDRLEVTLFDETFQQHRHIVAKDTVLVVSGSLRFDDFINNWRLTAKRVLSLDEALQQRAVGLVITWHNRDGDREFPSRLRRVLEPSRRGPCKIVLQYESSEAAARLEFSDDWSATPSENLLRDLRRLAGRRNVRLVRARGFEQA
jgi:DNA polymerase-3 subunit alpha